MRDLHHTPAPRRKDNCFGIELEFSSPHAFLERKVMEHKLQKYISLGHDSMAEPGNTAHELKILVSEQEMPSIIFRTIKMLKELDAVVNKSCGLHVHVDTRHRDRKKVYNNLVKAQPLLYSMVHPNRKKNKYCKIQKHTYDDILKYRRITNKWDISVKDAEWLDSHEQNDEYLDDRYVGVNLCDKYNTVEVRLHHGTLKAKEIINWCLLLKNIAEGNDIKEEIESPTKLGKFTPISSEQRKFLLSKRKEHKANVGKEFKLSYAKI